MKIEIQQKFLSFSLGEKDIALLTLEYVQEIFPIALTDICRVPQMPSCVLGVYNWRGEMLWLVNLEDMLGYPPLAPQARFSSKIMAIKLLYEEKSLGVLVRDIRDIEPFDPQFLKSPDGQLFSPDMAPFVQGYFVNPAEEILICLDVKAILQTPIWISHNQILS